MSRALKRAYPWLRYTPPLGEKPYVWRFACERCGAYAATSPNAKLAACASVERGFIAEHKKCAARSR